MSNGKQIGDAYGSRKKNEVMKDTWGHMYPEPGSKHQGTIYVAAGDTGATIISDDFPTLCSSPQRFELVQTALGLYEWNEEGASMLKIECTLWFFKSSNDYVTQTPGKIIKPSVSTVWSS